MKTSSLVTAARNLRNFAVFNVNARLGREFIPAQRDMLCIETTSACNLKCRMCGYVKKTSPKVNMPHALFVDVVEQALAMGFRRFQLTPTTGDVFMDPGLFEKLEYLDAQPLVLSYEFFTNFTIPDAAGVERLLGLEKLTHLTISIYGHDLDSFVAITQAKPKVHRRLLDNLETLLGNVGGIGFALDFGLRSVRGFSSRGESELLRMLQRFRDAGIEVRTSRIYNNWGGRVTDEDVRGLDIDITSSDSLYKKGACTLLFTDVQVMAGGIVNGCACRDIDATLRIGDLSLQSLREILSRDNPAYMQLIEEQQNGRYRPVCRGCDFYKSIYRNRSSNRRAGKATLTLEEFLATLG